MTCIRNLSSSFPLGLFLHFDHSLEFVPLLYTLVFSQISNLYPVLRVCSDILFLLILLECELFYNLVLISTVQKGESNIHIHTFPFGFPSLWWIFDLESTGMTCPHYFHSHFWSERHLAHAPNCWQHNQWYLQTLDFLRGCRVWRAVSPSKMALPICGKTQEFPSSMLLVWIHYVQIWRA